MTEAVTWQGGITLYRVSGVESRDLKVALQAGAGDVRELDFAAADPALDIDGLDPDVQYDLTVRPASLLARLRQGRQQFQVHPRPRPFRVLVSGSGRCGTQTFAHWLDGMTFQDGTAVNARHEALALHVLRAIIAGDMQTVARVAGGQQHNIESAPFYALAADQLRADRIVQLVRDGRRVVQSGMNRGWYDNDSVWNRIKPRFEGDVFTNCCHFWRHANAELEKVADLRIRLEDLSTDGAAQARILADLSIAPSDVPFPHANKGQGSSAASHWTGDQRRVFTEICGELMDRYYPHWQENW